MNKTINICIPGTEPDVLSVRICQQKQLFLANQSCILCESRSSALFQIYRKIHCYGPVSWKIHLFWFHDAFLQKNAEQESVAMIIVFIDLLQMGWSHHAEFLLAWILTTSNDNDFVIIAFKVSVVVGSIMSTSISVESIGTSASNTEIVNSFVDPSRLFK